MLLYLAWLVAPVLHQLCLGLEQCQACPAEEADWRVVSRPPDQPCSDPDHHGRPVHDEDHCPTCRLGAASIAELPFVGDAVQPVVLTHSVGDWRAVAPRAPALLTASPRAPPRPGIA